MEGHKKHKRGISIENITISWREYMFLGGKHGSLDKLNDNHIITITLLQLQSYIRQIYKELARLTLSPAIGFKLTISLVCDYALWPLFMVEGRSYVFERWRQTDKRF